MMKFSLAPVVATLGLALALTAGLCQTASAGDPFQRLGKSISTHSKRIGGFSPGSTDILIPKFGHDKRRNGVTGKWLGYEAGVFKNKGGLNLKTSHLGAIQAGPATIPYRLKTNDFFDRNGIRTNQHLHVPGIPKLGAVASQSVRRIGNGIRVSQDTGLSALPKYRIGDSHSLGRTGYKHYHHLNIPHGQYTGGVHFKTGRNGGVRLKSHFNRR